MANDAKGTVRPEFKRALKMFCVREGTSEQSWVLGLVEAELAKLAPDLSSAAIPSKKRGRR